MSLAVFADDSPLDKMKDETLSYFKPLTGRIVKVEGQKVLVNLGSNESVKVGMRFTILREGATFIHPVTKKPLGKVESYIGKLEIKEIGHDSSVGIVLEGEVKEGDKVRISEKQINVLFFQTKDTDWTLADTYFRDLKETGRFNLIETSIETDDTKEVLKEASRLNAEVALLLSSKKVDPDILLNEKLFWVSDGAQFSEINTKVDVAYAKELKFGEEFFSIGKKEVSITIDLPIGARLLSAGDIDGDKKQEIILSTGKDIRIYIPGADLQPALGGIYIKGSKSEEHLWIDTIDLNRNGIDEIIVTSMMKKIETEDVFREGSDTATLSTARSAGVVSSIYELKDGKFSLLYRGNLFMRKIGNELIAQAYSKDEGFSGRVFNVLWQGEYKRGSPLELPRGVNIYDFVFIDDPRAGRLVLSYDEKGYLNLYDKDMRLWRSRSDTGGFITTFKKSSPTIFVDKGEWAIKDRLFLKDREVLVVKRFPIFDLVKGLGFKRSQIRNLWWNGASMEEGILIDDIKGSILDYALVGDKIMVMVSPLFGIKAENILKGENPLGSRLYIYALKKG
ncbi:MAG: hypothetical protein ACPL1G_07920 [Thermodesulfovibrionales bacterium]